MTHMTDLPPGFGVERAHVAGAPSVVVRGELDMSTAAELAATLDDAIRESVGTLIVDLSDLVFLDSSGVKELIRARAVLGSEDRTLLVVCPPGPARRALELTGAAELLALVASRAEVEAR
jgi:anti-anti-sigma factor